MTLQNLSLWDVAIAALLIVVNGVVSVALKLDLERKLAAWIDRETNRLAAWAVLRPIEAKANLPILTVLADDSVKNR